MDTAFDSQVLPLLKAASKSQFNLIHFAFNPFHQKAREAYFMKVKELESTGIETISFRQLPPVSRGSLVLDTQRILPFFAAWWGNRGRVVLHCRGHMNAYRGLLLKRKHPELINVIADLRGAVSDEVAQGPRGFIGDLFIKYLKRFYESIENQVVLKADKILCVSNAFKEFLYASYGIRNISVIPTFVDTSQFKFSESLRQLYRDRLGTSNRTVLVYSGGVAPWQKLEGIISLFVNLKKDVDSLFMLFLTQEPRIIKKIIKDQIQPEDVKIIRALHSEVPGYLCAADVGILLRDNILTNNVASPIKFSEYMCSGLPCILSGNIGDTAEIIRRGNAGIILDSRRNPPTVNEFQRLLSLNREEISKFMSRYYSSEVYLPEILELYRAFNEGK
jgi:glycosyltransferase involved in cell wall biosynthesis